MKKIVLLSAIAAMMTACGGNDSKSASKGEASAQELSEEQSATYTSDTYSSGSYNTSSSKWTLSRYDNGIEEYDETTTYDGNIKFGLSKIAEVTSSNVGVEEKGSGANTYYVISPTVKITSPVENVVNIIAGLELLDDSGSPISYTYSLAGKEYTNTNYMLSNEAVLKKALKDGGECQLSFKIEPSKYIDFSTNLFDEAKYFRISSYITASPQE